MPTVDIALAAFLLSQPLALGIALFGLSRLSLGGYASFSFAKTTRRRLLGVKFFECAAHPRLLSAIQYDIVALSACILFVLYDVDLIFFFVEAICFDGWSLGEAAFVGINFILLILGLAYDYCKLGFD